MYKNRSPGASVITGIGRVSGLECVIVWQRRHREGRHLLPDDGEEASPCPGSGDGERLPTIYMVDSGGANLPQWLEVFPDKTHFGRIFYNQASMSAQGIRRSRS